MSAIRSVPAPPRHARGWLRTVHAYVADTGPATGAPGVDVVFLDARGRILSTVRRAHADAATRDLAAFRGIVLAFWTARRLGARAVVVHNDNPAVVKQITGEVEVAPALVGPYLQIRALMHAYRIARVQTDDLGGAREALAAAVRRREPHEFLDDLPLWERAAVSDRSPRQATASTG